MGLNIVLFRMQIYNAKYRFVKCILIFLFCFILKY